MNLYVILWLNMLMKVKMNLFINYEHKNETKFFLVIIN